MRGRKAAQTNFLCLVNVEDRIPREHPIRQVKKLVGEVLGQMDGHFDELYAEGGRDSVPPERLLGAKVLMALYSVRSERQFCERLRYDLLFQWFLDINPDENWACFAPTVFTKNQARLIGHATAEVFFVRVVELAREHQWVSNEHFSVDGTLIEAWGSMKSFRRKDDEGGPGAGNGWSDFKGQHRSNDTHQSQSDPEAKLLRKGAGREARLCFGLHSAMENRNGLCVAMKVHPSVGVTETQAALEQADELIERDFDPRTIGADKGYHSAAFVSGCRERGIAPHAAQIDGRQVAGLDGRTTTKGAYRSSLIVRRRIEEIFGWVKTIGGLRRSRYRGVERTQLCAQMVGAAYNLVRMAKLMLSAPAEVGA